MAERRRLPVLSNVPPPASKEQNEDERPPLHWVGFGVVAIFAGWLPLTYVAGAVSSRVMVSRFGADASRDAIELALHAMSSAERARLMAIVALPGMLALALAAFGGGVIVGRFGKGTTAREAALSGAATALIASAMAWPRDGSGITLAALVASAVTFVVAIGFSAWGGRLGTERRRLLERDGAPSA